MCMFIIYGCKKQQAQLIVKRASELQGSSFNDCDKTHSDNQPKHKQLRPCSGQACRWRITMFGSLQAGQHHSHNCCRHCEMHRVAQQLPICHPWSKWNAWPIRCSSLSTSQSPPISHQQLAPQKWSLQLRRVQCRKWAHAAAQCWQFPNTPDAALPRIITEVEHSMLGWRPAFVLLAPHGHVRVIALLLGWTPLRFKCAVALVATPALCLQSQSDFTAHIWLRRMSEPQQVDATLVPHSLKRLSHVLIQVLRVMEQLHPAQAAFLKKTRYSQY